MKRTLDIIISVIFLLVPFILAYIILAPFIKLTSKGPLIFKQKRLGKDKKLFCIYKFRSMYLNDDASCELKEDPRVTPVGRFIRKFKIDELPQVINIFKGDMSLVGPRPYSIRASHEAVFFAFADCRYCITPGLTCLSFITIDDEGQSREDLIKERIAADKNYLLKRSLALDVKIIWLTAIKIIKRVRI